MGSYDNKISKSYNAAISIPITSSYQVYDNEYGKQNVTLIAYYDQISNFHYDPDKKSMSFVMPFDWSNTNLRQAIVVHQEIKIPKSFGDFIVTKYDAYVNRIKLPENAIIIDDYSSDDRIVHLILYKQELSDLSKKQHESKPEMDFSLSPSNETSFPIQQFTRNAQYKASLSWDPPKIFPGAPTNFKFQILDPYLFNKTVNSIDYDFSVIEDKNNVIFYKSGKTSSDGSLNTIGVPFPSNFTGPVTIGFENLNGNSFADSGFSAFVINPSSTPEFPATFYVLFIVLALVILLTRI